VSFGTIVWRYFAEEAEGVLRALAEASSAVAPVRLRVGLGGARLSPATAAVLRDADVRVEGFVDQWEALREADVFVTHHGINSTHEAIYHRVPMLSYPFFWDQPALARTCQEMGLALPLSEALRGAIGPGDVKAAWERLLESRGTLHARLTEARAWEARVIEARGAVVERIRALVRAGV
jgi:UDP:flavonoid glycosyltransferase YjiC (YdhE family)